MTATRNGFKVLRFPVQSIRLFQLSETKRREEKP